MRRVAEGGASQIFGSVLVAAISFAHPPALQNCLALAMRFVVLTVYVDASANPAQHGQAIPGSGDFAPVQFLSIVDARNCLAVLR